MSEVWQKIATDERKTMKQIREKKRWMENGNRYHEEGALRKIVDGKVKKEKIKKKRG